MNTFKGASQSSDVIEIKQVILNRDRSHLTVLWSCSILDGFVRMVHETGMKEHKNGGSGSYHTGSRDNSTPSGRENNRQFDDDESASDKVDKEAVRIWTRGVTYINKMLALREPQFRSFLARKVQFRRIPRVFFKGGYRPPFTHSFVHPFIRSSIHSFIHPFTLIHSFIHSFTHSPILPSIHPFSHAPILPLIHSLIHPFAHSFTHSFTHLPIHSFAHSPIHSLIYSGPIHLWFNPIPNPHLTRIKPNTTRTFSYLQSTIPR